jgi:hypothetical protein
MLTAQPPFNVDKKKRYDYAVLLYRAGLDCPDIAKLFGVRPSSVNKFIRNRGVVCRKGHWEHRNPQWRPEGADYVTLGHARARSRFKVLELCEQCHSSKARDRHHKDGNTFNNDRANVTFLCRRCHMLIDGRMDKLLALPKTASKPPRPCLICLRPHKIFRHGRCPRCAEYFKRNGKERPNTPERVRVYK